MPATKPTYDYPWRTVTFPESPLLTDAAIINFDIGSAKVLLDWNRNREIIFINDRKVADILLEESGKTQFSNIEELKEFFKKHLLSNLYAQGKPQGEKALNYLLQVGHQGGLVAPISGPLAELIERITFDKLSSDGKILNIGVAANAMEFTTAFTTTDQGFTVKETVKIKSILNRGDPESPIEPDPGKNYILKYSPTIDVNFNPVSDKKEQKAEPPYPVVKVENNTVSYGNDKIQKLLCENINSINEKNRIFESELKKLNNHPNTFLEARNLLVKANAHYEKLIKSPEVERKLDPTKLIPILKLANSINDLSDPNLKLVAQKHFADILKLDPNKVEQKEAQDQAKLEFKINSQLKLFIQLNELDKAIKQSTDSTLKNHGNNLYTASCAEIEKLMKQPNQEREALIITALAYGTLAINGAIKEKDIEGLKNSLAETAANPGIGYKFLGSFMAVIGCAMKIIQLTIPFIGWAAKTVGAEDAGNELYKAGIKIYHFGRPSKFHLGSEKLFKDAVEKIQKPESPIALNDNVPPKIKP